MGLIPCKPKDFNSLSVFVFCCTCSGKDSVSREAKRVLENVHRLNQLAQEHKHRDLVAAHAFLRAQCEEIGFAVKRGWAHVSALCSNGYIGIHAITGDEWLIPYKYANIVILRQLAQHMIENGLGGGEAVSA